MLHLQARYQFQTNHRAALKSLDKPINEAETFQHIAWVYAFRFLKVSLTLQIAGRIESVPALQQLHAILSHAERQGDRAIYVACSALEAMVHLRSGAPDRIEQAQRAIAAARSLQLQESSKQLGSFGSLIDIIDLACGIQQGNPNNQKSTALIESMMDENNSSPSNDNGVFGVLLERSSAGNMTFDTGGIFRKSSDGRDELVFAWLPREDLKTLCFHMSALDQNVHEKGLRYIKEAHHRSKGMSRIFFVQTLLTQHRCLNTTIIPKHTHLDRFCAVRLGSSIGLAYNLHSWPHILFPRRRRHRQGCSVHLEKANRTSTIQQPGGLSPHDVLPRRYP
jgi:hypothetical protein